MAMPVQQDTTATAAAPRGTFAFIIPPPVTIWLQFDDGTQVGVTPTPQRIMGSMMGMPFMGGMPMMMMPGLFGNGAYSDDGVARAIHELFMRSQQQPQGPPPTSKAFLDKIPLKTWTSQLKATEKCTDCSICLCDYEDNDEVLPLPCGHQFHKDCGMKWLIEHNVCPTCRYALPTNDATATKPEQTAASTQPEPVAEPQAEPEPARTTRVRPRSPRLTPERQVRRRLSERDVFALPGAVDTTTTTQEDELDSMLEEEATRFVAEEQERSRMNDVNFDDIDIEDLLHDSSN